MTQKNNALISQVEIIDFSRKRNLLILLLMGLLYTGVSFYYLDKNPILYQDESFFNEPCENFLKEGSFSTYLFPKYGGFNKSNLFQGRIFSMFQVFVFKVMGVSAISLRIQPFLAGLGTLLLTFFISKIIFQNSFIGLMTSFLLAISHLFLFASHLARPDMTVSLFVVGSVFVFLQAEKRNNLSLFFLSGLIATLAIDVHPPGNIAVFVLFGLAAHQLFSKLISWKAMRYICIGLAAGLFWWVTWHVLIDISLYFEQRNAIRFYQVHTLFIDTITMVSKELWRWYSFFWQGAYHRNMFLLFLFIFVFFHAIRKHKVTSYRTILIILLSGFLGLWLGAPNNTPWYIIYIYPFLIMLTSGVLYHLYFSSFYSQKIIAIILTSGLVLFSTLENLGKLKFYSSNYYTYIEKIKTYIPKGSIILGSDNQWLGLKDHTQFIGNYIVLCRPRFKRERILTDYYAGSLEDLFHRLKIQYIIADEEFLTWGYDGDSLLLFIKNNCEFIGEFTDSFYGISHYLCKKSPRPLLTKIYRVKPL